MKIKSKADFVSRSHVKKGTAFEAQNNLYIRIYWGEAAKYGYVNLADGECIFDTDKKDFNSNIAVQLKVDAIVLPDGEEK